MKLAGILNSAPFAIGLVGALMLVLAILAYLKNRHVIKERTGNIILVVIFLLALLALTVNLE
jgi:hypothetical protein